ncbi:MAG: gliding motility-associated C-terminal domain-containing protein [Bacteroidota bacterium]
MKSILNHLMFLIGSLLFAVLSEAQTPAIDWEKTLGGSSWEELHALIPCSDGGILVAAITQSDDDGDILFPKMGDWDYWLIKLDINGNQLWQKRYGGNKADRIWVGKETRDGGFIIGGESRSDAGGDKSEANKGDWDFWMVKLDKNGELEWDKTIGGSGWDAIRGDIIETQDGGYLLAGISDSPISGDKTEDNRGDWDYWIVKTDARGNVLWDKTYGGAQRELLQAVWPLADGSFLLGGESRSDVSGDKEDFLRGLNDYWVMRIDANGNEIWQKTIGGNFDEAIFDIAQIGETIYLAGFSGSWEGFEKTVPSYGSIDYWVVAIDMAGNILWNKVYGGSGPDNAYDIRVNAVGNLVLAGISSSEVSGSKTANSEGTVDYWVVYLSPDGEQLWDESYGANLRDALTEMEVTEDGSIVMAGHTESTVSGDKTEASRGVNDVWVVKTSCSLGASIEPSVRASCFGQPTTVAANFTECIGCDYRWSNGSRDSIFIIPKVNDTVTYTVRASNFNGCINYDTITVFNSFPEQVNFDLFPENCGYQIEVGEIIGGTPPYTSFLYADSFVLQNNFEILTPGDSFRLVVQDAYGCPLDTTFQAGEAIDLLSVHLGEEEIVKLGDSLKIEAITNRPVVEVNWVNLPKDSCMDCLERNIFPLEQNTIQVEVIDELGCRAYDELRYFIDREYNMFIPNAFSPDDDGRNDTFVLYGGTKVNQVKSLRVFDRWGRLLFEREDFFPNAPADGWDGYFNGILSPSGIYIYITEVEYVDGHIAIFKGDVALMR